MFKHKSDTHDGGLEDYAKPVVVVIAILFCVGLVLIVAGSWIP